MHPRISELCTALGLQLPIFLWFAIILFMVLWLFGFQASLIKAYIFISKTKVVPHTDFLYWRAGNDDVWECCCDLFWFWYEKSFPETDQCQRVAHYFLCFLGGALATASQISWSKLSYSRSSDSQLQASLVAISKRSGLGYLDLKTVAPTSAWLFYYPVVIVTWMFLMLG